MKTQIKTVEQLTAEAREKVLKQWAFNGYEKNYPIDGEVFNGYVKSAVKHALIAQNSRTYFEQVRREDYQRGGAPLDRERWEEVAHFQRRAAEVRKQTSESKCNTRQAIKSGLV